MQALVAFVWATKSGVWSAFVAHYIFIKSVLGCPRQGLRYVQRDRGIGAHAAMTMRPVMCTTVLRDVFHEVGTGAVETTFLATFHPCSLPDMQWKLSTIAS
jgi:hypothetical protein